MDHAIRAGALETTRGEWDEDGFNLSLDCSDEQVLLRVTSTEAARELLSQLKNLQSWVDEHDHEYAAYIAASPQEREAVLLGVVVEDSDEADAERLRDAADIARKRAKGE